MKLRPSSAELKSHEALAERMVERGISVRPLAKLVNRGVSTIGRLRSGTRTKCSREVAEAIAQVLNVPLDDLFRLPVVPTVPCPCADQCAGHEVAA